MQNFYNKVILVLFLTPFFVILYLAKFTHGKSQYVQPLNMGLQISIPYDIANIFNRPVHLGPLASIILSGCLLWILFFGVITSPFGYFFGIPSEKYVLGQSWQSVNGKEESPNSSSNGRSLGDNFQNHTMEYPNFLHSSFYLMGDVEDEECQKLVLCHAHRILPKLPKLFLNIYHFFSKKLMGIKEIHQESIRVGLQGEDYCEERYDSCSESVFGILVRSAVNLMPKWTRYKSLKPDLTF